MLSLVIADRSSRDVSVFCLHLMQSLNYKTEGLLLTRFYKGNDNG